MSTSPEIAVRAARADDVSALVLLMEEFYAESGYPLDAQWAASAFSALLSRPDWGRTWIAHSGGRAVGHVVQSVRYTMEHGGLSAYVDDLFVKPAFRRMGVARALLDRLFDDSRARGCRSVQVEAGKANTAALALYAKFGLVPHQDDRLLLAVALTNATA
jgi:ribosomal protein S18 acetylase RimI-like enzyme